MRGSSDHVLFQPIKLGRMQLGHRIVMSPMTRFRADKNHVQGDLAVEYYSQRGSVPGTLLITEGTFISPQAGGLDLVPGIYTTEQIAGWKRITDAVHAKGSFMYLQLWALGRSADPEVLAREGDFSVVSASTTPVKGGPEPRPLTVPEIRQHVHDYAQAARNAIMAGFDGVEIHSANGYLLDQFLQDVTNQRTDEYGGSIQARSRFCLEVVKAVVAAVGEDRTGIRLSPWSVFQNMGMADPVPQFLYFVRTLRDNHPDLAYIHLTEPTVKDLTNIHLMEPPAENGMPLPDANDVFRDAWAPKPILSASGHTVRSALESSEKKGDIIVFGRHFIANPDLPLRLKEGIPLNTCDGKTFYTQSAIGYTDYPFAERPKVG